MVCLAKVMDSLLEEAENEIKRIKETVKRDRRRVYESRGVRKK